MPLASELHLVDAVTELNIVFGFLLIGLVALGRAIDFWMIYRSRTMGPFSFFSYPADTIMQFRGSLKAISCVIVLVVVGGYSLFRAVRGLLGIDLHRWITEYSHLPLTKAHSLGWSLGRLVVPLPELCGCVVIWGVSIVSGILATSMRGLGRQRGFWLGAILGPLGVLACLLLLTKPLDGSGSHARDAKENRN